MKLMTADEVKRRLAAGEDALSLSLEHWLQIARWLKTHAQLPPYSYGAHICPLCLKYDGYCDDCPLYQSTGMQCFEPGTPYDTFKCDSTYENALGVVAALARCKPVKTESPEQQFYVWREGEPPQGKVGLRLIKWLDNPVIMLAVVGKDGKMIRAGRLLRIYPDGSQYRHVNVNPESGLDLDDAGRLRLQRET